MSRWVIWNRAAEGEKGKRYRKHPNVSFKISFLSENALVTLKENVFVNMVAKHGL